MAHLISSEGKAFCGRPITLGEIMDDNWDSSQYEHVCDKCREWHHIITKRHIVPGTVA